MKFMVILLAVAGIVLSASPALAHRVLIEPVEEGVVKVSYEDGRFSRRTEVFVYDQEGEELYRGGLDEEGYFHYPPELEAALIVADDNLGHRAEWKVGAEVREELPRGITVALVLLVFCSIAAYFHFRTARSGRC